MKYDRLINRCLDGEASKQDEKLLKELLQKDSSFKKQYEEAKMLFNIMDDTIELETPAYVSERILNSIEYSKSEKRSFFSKFALPALATALSVYLGIFSTNILFTNSNTAIDESSQTTVVASVSLDDYLTVYYDE